MWTAKEIAPEIFPIMGMVGRTGGYPLPPNLWNQRFAAKYTKNLWRTISYGQNLELKGLS